MLIVFEGDGPNCLVISGKKGPKKEGPKEAYFRFLNNNLSIRIAIALELYHKVQYNKQKIGIHFLGDCPNRSGIKRKSGLKQTFF